MKINQRALSQALGRAISFISKTPTLPVVGHFLLALKGNNLTISATNLESRIQLSVPCESGKDDWQTTVPARLFFDLVKSLSGEITLRFKTRLSVSCDEIRSYLSTIDASEFPLMPQMPENKPLEFNAADLLVCLSSTIHAAAQDESRPILTGVNFASNGERLTVTAADGFRMAIYRMPYEGELFNVTIPAVFLDKLARILSGKKSETIKVYTNDNQAFFELENVSLVSQLIAGAFVNVNALIPKSHQALATLRVSSLKAVLKPLLIIATRQDGYVNAKFTPGGINLAAQSTEEGDIESPVQARFEGEPYESAFSGTLLTDAINNLNGDICLEQNGKSAPLAIYEVEKRDEYINIIMPMQVKNRT